MFALVALAIWSNLEVETTAARLDMSAALSIRSKLSLPPNIAFLSGGPVEHIQKVMRGIPKAGNENRMKLGPGLYTTAFQHQDGDWSATADGKTWHEKVWRANGNIDQSYDGYPFVLVIKLREGMRFGLVPRNIWYGQWSGSQVDNKLRCLSEFDALLIPHVTEDDQQCKSAWREVGYSSLQCLTVREELVAHLVGFGCIQELKVNPGSGRERFTQLVSLAAHNPAVQFDGLDFMDLGGVPVGGADPLLREKVNHWLCLRSVRLSGRHTALNTTHRGVLKACGEALSAWGHGQIRPDCEGACHSAKKFLDAKVASLYQNLGRTTSLRRALDGAWFWKMTSNSSRTEYRQLRATLLWQSACKAAPGTLATAAAKRRCSLKELEDLCQHDPDWSIEASSTICMWL